MPPAQQNDSWRPWDVAASPVFNILDTATQLPFVNETGANDWLWETPFFQGARNFQDEHPGWSLATDVAGAFVPFVGWGGALGRAGLEGAGVLSSVNRAGRAAAQVFPRSPSLAFAAGETVRYAPLSAGITAFDALGGRYESPVDAAASFGLGTIGGAGLQAAGAALSPIIAARAPAVIGGAWRALFDPGPELSRLYGFSDNVKRAAEQTAAQPAVQQALSPTYAPQQRAAMLWDLIAEARAGQHPDVDPDVLQGQYDQEVASILRQELDPVEQSFRFAPNTSISEDLQRAYDQSIRLGPSGSGNRVRVPLTASGNQWENPDVLAGRLELPEGWVHSTILPGVTQVNLPSSPYYRAQIGLSGSTSNPLARRMIRTTPSGQEQLWSVTPEHDGGFLLATELPALGSDIHRMTGRARYAATRGMNKTEAAKSFFSFKTHEPGRFFDSDEWRLDVDSADLDTALRLDDRIPRGQSEFLDKIMEFRNLYLNPNTIRAAHEARLARKGGQQRIAAEMLRGPSFGKEIANFFETYTLPTEYQLGESPEGRSILGLYQALFDAAEGRKNRLLFGMASIPDDKNPITALFSPPDMDDSQALATGLRKALEEDSDALAAIQAFNNGDVPLESIEGTPAGAWIKTALEANKREMEEINKMISALTGVGATDARLVALREGHFGLTRRWDGSNIVPIYKDGQLEPDAVVAGHSKAQAESKAQEWMEARAKALAARGELPETRRMGKAFVVGVDKEVPAFVKMSTVTPGLLEPRAGMMGYEHQYEPYKHVDKLIAELEQNYTQRWRYAASVAADALTGGKLNQLYARDKTAFRILQTRIAQLKGQEGPLEERLNQIVDSVAAPYVGTKSLTKTVEAVNGTMFHLLHGVMNIATPLLNLTSVVQTQLPEAINFLTARPEVLKGLGYQLPVFGADGLPRAGFNFVTDPIGLLSGGFKRMMKPSDEDREVFNAVFNKREMGASLANEYTGQDRTIARRVSEGIRGPEDIAHWANKASSMLMSKTEQISRTNAVGMALESMTRMEAATGVKFTMDQRIANALKMVYKTNYGYFNADRPMMFTSPLGAIFGNQKTWMTNYLFQMARYLGLGVEHGNWAPLLFGTGATALLGGAFAVPLIGSGIDAWSRFFEDKPGTEWIYENLGEGGNAISFGLPALFGVSLQGNVSAPGSNLAHDAEFFFTLVALERAKLAGRAVGRAWDDQVTLGMNPMKDRIWRQQTLQAFAPRSLYRAYESLLGDQLRSAATGYPMTQEFGPGARILHGLGFRETDIAIQYAAYADLLQDRDAMRSKVSMFGEAYAQASLSGDRSQMQRLLQQAAVQGVDVSSMMRSAQIRMRNEGKDMFGRNFTGEQLEQYQQTLAAGGRGL